MYIKLVLFLLDNFKFKAQSKIVNITFRPVPSLGGCLESIGSVKFTTHSLILCIQTAEIADEKFAKTNDVCREVTHRYLVSN